MKTQIQPIKKHNNDITALDALYKVIELGTIQNKESVIDIGCGKLQPHVNIFKQHFTEVYTCDFYEENDYKGLFVDIKFNKQFDIVWSAHCLEHQQNVGLFLKQIYNITKENGIVCITVPPAKHNIVGGHLSLWNIGILYYNLILAGFDCSNAIHKRYGYNLSIILNKKTITDLPALYFDNGDIELISKYFPFKAVQGFDGNNLSNTF